MSSNGDGDDKQILKKSHSSFIRCSDLNLEETILLDSEQVEKLKLRSEDLWVCIYLYVCVQVCHVPLVLVFIYFITILNLCFNVIARRL